MKVDSHVFTALEMQHAIVRACMGPPKDFDFDENYPVYMVNDPKGLLKCCKPEPLVNFGFYFPFKSAPPLTFFTVECVTNELRQVLWNCLLRTKFKSKKQLTLPGIMREYEDDFLTGRDRDQFVELLKSCVPEHLGSKYLNILDKL